MNDVEKCYRRAINYNARTIQYALLHIVHQKGSEKTVYYEEDYLNKAGLHTIYYGYNVSDDAPELVVRSYKFATKKPHACVWDESRFSLSRH